MACRETRELRQEEINRGRALTKIIKSLESSAVSGWEKITNTNHLSGYALISNVWKIQLKTCLHLISIYQHSAKRGIRISEGFNTLSF